MLDGGSVCRCVCACVSVLFGQIDFVVGQGVSGGKKNLLKVLLFPRDHCQIITHTHTHSAEWQSALLSSYSVVKVSFISGQMWMSRLLCLWLFCSWAEQQNIYY